MRLVCIVMDKFIPKGINHTEEKMIMANPFVHIELHTGDLAKAKDFYGKSIRLEAGGYAAPGR